MSFSYGIGASRRVRMEQHSGARSLQWTSDKMSDTANELQKQALKKKPNY